MDCQQIFNNIISNLEYDNIDYDIIPECGKTVVNIKGKDGIMKLTVDFVEK